MNNLRRYLLAPHWNILKHARPNHLTKLQKVIKIENGGGKSGRW